MKNKFGLALTAIAIGFATPAFAGFVPINEQQQGFACNTWWAAHRFNRVRKEGPEKSLGEIAKMVSTPREWCVTGTVRQPSQPTIMAIGGEKDYYLVHTYKTLDRRQMFYLVSAPHGS